MYLKESLAFVYYGSIVNNRPQKSTEDAYVNPQSQDITHQRQEEEEETNHGSKVHKP